MWSVQQGGKISNRARVTIGTIGQSLTTGFSEADEVHFYIVNAIWSFNLIEGTSTLDQKPKFVIK